MAPSSGSTACSGCGMRPMTLRRSFTTPATSSTRAVRVAVRVAEHDLRRRARPRRAARRPRTSPFAVLDRDREHVARRAPAVNGVSALLDAHAHVGADEVERRVAPQDAGKQARLAQDLEAVADAEHRPALVGERAHRAHRRREARDRAAAQVVAVREAARQDRRRPRRAAARPRATRARPSAPSSSSARSASRSSLEPGNETTATRAFTGRPRSRTTRSAGSRAAGRTSARAPRAPAPRRAASTSRSTSRPTRAPPTSKPSCRSAAPTASPCGSRMPSLGRTSTVAFNAAPRPGRRGSRRTGSPVSRSNAST